ncbi:hypothetical protein KP509_06G035400 [Ceratopteris richardii]|uniref:Secreted protein n=1 Tax=Ceratopteris richardii TaxID=49495 RepID=A0A8T2UJD9_CERRI|nr:hypothetical protein KP509_06G035400 [Ceratopteris richardii]
MIMRRQRLIKPAWCLSSLVLVLLLDTRIKDDRPCPSPTYTFHCFISTQGSLSLTDRMRVLSHEL